MARQFRALVALLAILLLAWCSGAFAGSIMEAPERISPDRPAVRQTPPTPAPPDTTIEEVSGAISTHGDWQIRCETLVGSRQCALTQSFKDPQRDDIGLVVVVLRIADHQSQFMRVIGPLGVFLPDGLRLIVDEADLGRAPFIRCSLNGCVAEVMLDNEILDRLRSGKSAIFTISQMPGDEIRMPISLAGFGPGFDALP